MLTFRIAFRSIFRQKRRSLLTALTMVGGFVLASFSIAFMEGTYNHVINQFTRNSLGHIQIHHGDYTERPSLYKTIDEYREVGDAVGSTPGVIAWAPRIYSGGLSSLGDKSAGARIIGIDPQKEEAATGFTKKLRQGHTFSETAAHEAILGQGLADILSARLGDSIVVLSQGADGSLANDMYEMVGTVETGNQMDDISSFYLHLADAQELLVLSGQVHEIAIICEELDELGMVAADIRSGLENDSLSVETWHQFARQFYQAMMADKQSSWIPLTIIIIVVAIGVLNTVLMTVMERRREYGLLRAVGTGPAQVFGLVLLETGFLALMSIAVATVISLIANHTMSIHGLTLGETISYGGMDFSTYYTELNLRSFWLPGLSVFGSALLVAIFPALKAAHTKPARTMRMH